LQNAVIQDLIDRYYSTAYERIWAQFDRGEIEVDEALRRTEAAWDKAAARILRDTGYSI
jgi:hypothetical protein